MHESPSHAAPRGRSGGFALRSAFDAENVGCSSSAEGAGRDESRGGYWEGEPSESLKPIDGFGMKQGRADEGGTNRQEVEKA
jgi:hypothetical protein